MLFSDLSSGRVSRDALGVLHLRTDGRRRSAQVVSDVRDLGLAAVGAFSTRHSVRRSNPPAGREHKQLHRPVRAADQPVQREDLSARLVLADFRRCGYLRQSAALDFKTLNHVHTGHNNQSFRKLISCRIASPFKMLKSSKLFAGRVQRFHAEDYFKIVFTSDSNSCDSSDLRALFRYVTNQPPKADSAFHPSGVGK